MKTESEDNTRFYLPAVSRFVVGCVTGIVTALIIQLLLHVFPAALDFSRDFGQRLAVRSAVPTLSAVERRAGIEGYLFLDVDTAYPTERLDDAPSPSEAACRAYERRLREGGSPAAPLDCQPGRPLNRHLLARLVEEAVARGARLVVLDVNLARDGAPIAPAETDDLAQTLLRHADRTLFVAPLEPSASPLPGFQLNVAPRAASILPEPEERRMSAAAVSAPETVLRHYPDCVAVGTEPVTLKPSLPALAAQRIRDARVRDPACEYDPSPESPLIYYSLAALTTHLGQVGESTAMDVYGRCPATLFWVNERPNREPCADSGAYTNRVVVIGASNLERGDVHMTPLGRMSGPEVLINAIRSFVAHPTLHEVGYGRELSYELIFVAFTAAIWALAELALRWRARRGHRPKLMVRLTLFLVCPLMIVVLSFYWNFRPHAADPRLDVLIPMLSVVLEMLGELTTWLTATIEHGLERRWKLRRAKGEGG